MRGVSTSPRSSSRSPAPSLPRGQAHSSLPTPTPRGPNTGHGPALLLAHCQPQPSPSCPSRHDAGTAGICLLQNTWPWHSLARSGVGAGSGGLGWPHSGVPVPPFPKPRQALGQAGPGRAQVAVAEDTRGDISPWGSQGPSSSCLLPCCAAARSPVPVHTPGAPLEPQSCRSSVFIPELPGHLISVTSKCQPGRGTQQALPRGCSCKTARQQPLLLVMRCRGPLSRGISM